MTDLFDGVASLLGETFGALVEYRRASASSWAPVQSVLRLGPITITDSDGHAVLIEGPSWRVVRRLVPQVKRGDLLRSSTGTTYQILNVHPTGSPASDAAVVCALEEIDGEPA